MDTLKDVPEFFETQLDESLNARTESLASFRELGPADLCHITKANAKPGVKEVGSYHYVSGVDASSSATLAAYLNSLTYALEETHAWFSKSSAWRIRSGVYCCFNAFSRVDVRVEVKIPGGVESYVVDLRGERHEATPEIWQETYISALLRSILYSDDANYRLAGFRKLDPIPNIEAEAHFLEATENIFFKGWQLGSEPEIQVATVVSNHLTTGIMKYFSENFRYEHEEIKAVNILYEALKQNQMSYALLHVQTDFLLSKGKTDYTLKLAKQAVNCAPSEFVTWAKLTEVYTEIGDYESADVALLRLPAPSLRGTFAKAYSLLTRLVAKIGWDELLKCRSSVFVMEEEYRMQKAAEEERKSQKTAATITTTQSQSKESEKDQTQPKESKKEPQPRESKKDAEIENSKTNGVNDSSQSIPTITVSDDDQNKMGNENSSETQQHSTFLETINEVHEEANGRQEEKTDGGQEENEIYHAAPVDEQSLDSYTLEEVNLDDDKSVIEFKGPELEKPSQAANDEKNDNQSIQNDDQNKDAKKDYSFSFNNKRLCERWLDNLFMVLYEDLRVYTVWRSEVSHYKAHHMSYRKTGTEWEILGDLAARLHHKEDAKEAYQRCLDHKFSAKAWLKLLEYHAEERDVHNTLTAVVKLAVYQERWYHEIVYPTAISYNLNKLIRSEGISKIHYNLISMNLSPPVAKLVESQLKLMSKPYINTSRETNMMESNKDEANRCFEIAREHFSEGNFIEAIKFAKKSIKLFPTKEAEVLLKRSESTKQTNNRESSRQSASLSSSSSREHKQGRQTREYTPEQAEAVKRIRSCNVNDYYAILGIKKDGTDLEVKKAYRKMHPDKNGAPGADEAFKMVGKAFQILSDPQKRAVFDEHGADPDSRSPGMSTGFRSAPFNGFANGAMFTEEISPEEIFNMFFGDGFHSATFIGPGFRARRYQPRRASPNGEGVREQRPSPFLTFFQLLPLILLFIFSFSSNWLTSTPDSMPDYSLERTELFSQLRLTESFRIPYYIAPNQFTIFEQDPQKLQQFEYGIELRHVKRLSNECNNEVVTKQRMIREAQGMNIFPDREKLKKIQDTNLPSCEKLRELSKSPRYKNLVARQ
ncbi:9954_t:CDS:10 [Diversispora eburnea]|uniref:9954_t:CDS:1 n=1 Tax=Diversispora eburnea TaxID=1213867 RepID=A0A9N9BH15_9GLOM|nr:9954_t:CDS:10 [Diversispora eburnea]